MEVSYISGNGNTKKNPYISVGGTFLCFTKLLQTKIRATKLNFPIF